MVSIFTTTFSLHMVIILFNFYLSLLNLSSCSHHSLDVLVLAFVQAFVDVAEP